MRYVGRKAIFYLIAAWAAITLNFALPRLMPGNPVDIMLARLQQQGGQLSPGARKSIELLLGDSNQGNLFTQYFGYLKNIFTGDFGISVTYFPTPVATVMAQAIPWTLILVGLATVISSLLGVGAGMIVGWRRGTWLDALIPSSTFIAAIPYFWLALVLVYVLAQRLAILPLSGGYDYSTTIGLNGPFIVSALQHAVLPALTIVISSIAGWLLGMRNMMVSTLSEDYVTTARAKGLRPGRVMVVYAARNAVLPSVAGFAISLGFVVGGSVLTETVFSYPGIGFTLLQAVQNNDYALMQGVFLIITLAVLGANFIVDVLYTVIDPRTRAGV